MEVHTRGDIGLPHAPIVLKICKHIGLFLTIQDQNVGAMGVQFLEQQLDNIVWFEA